MFSLRTWRPRHLFLAWVTYWVGLILVRLGPALYDISQLSRVDDGKGNASINFGDAGFSATITNAGTTVWSGSVSFLSLTLWIVGPPLVIWGAWLLARPKQLPPAGVSDRAADTDARAGVLGRPPAGPFGIPPKERVRDQQDQF